MNHPQPARDRYTIKIEGLLSLDWVDWPSQAEIQHEMEGSVSPAVTILTVTLPDQPALHGLLEKVRDLNLKLISVQRLDQADSL